MDILHCRHRWGFPRRWPEFEGRRSVDVQTCLKCGTRRVSLVQFGPAQFDAPAPRQGFFKWIHTHS